MKKLAPFTILILTLISCNKENDQIGPEEYYINFMLKNQSGNVYKLNLPYESVLGISGNPVKDSEFFSVGFEISVQFQSPNNDAMQQRLAFYIGVKVPAEELIQESGQYKFISPANFQNYIPNGNMFDQNNSSFFTFFHEDTSTFCTAQNNEQFSNIFEFTSSEFIIDENQNDAVIFSGTFSTKYDSICENGSFEIVEGSFRIKALVG